jgi:hypothetical protein
MFGSLRLEEDQFDPLEAIKKKPLKILYKPSITKDYLSLRILPLKLQ